MIIGTRPSSLASPRPELAALLEAGASARAVDLSTFANAELDEAVAGVDIVISTANFSDVMNQKKLVDAAARAGVKRFIPDDWATACVLGVRQVYDMVSLLAQVCVIYVR